MCEVESDWQDRESARRELLDAALTLCKLSPHAERLISEFVGNIVPILNRELGRHKSLSVENCFGTVFASFDCTAEVLAEALIHEADHQYLYQVGSRKHFFSDLPSAPVRLFMSPWRRDPRPQEGLLLGASAFSRVAGCFIEAMASNPSLARVVGSRCTLYVLQVGEALHALREHCTLSADGLELISELQEEVEQAAERLREWRPFPTWHQRALGLLQTHKLKWKRENCS
jgi:HEXXH motif-containing protein